MTAIIQSHKQRYSNNSNGNFSDTTKNQSINNITPYGEFYINKKLLTVRKAVSKDAKSLFEYIETICAETQYLTFGSGEVALTVEMQKLIIEKSCNSLSNLLIIGVIDNAIVANLRFTPGIRPRTCHAGEFGISVLKKYWRHKIGSQLMQIFIQWAKDSGKIKKLNLKVRKDNKRAIKLYTKFGFVVEGIITREFYVNNRFYDAYFMGLKI